LLSFPAEDPGSIEDRISASASDVAAAEVGVAFGHVLLPFGDFPHAADEISACKIVLGITEIFPRHAEFLRSTAIVVVAAMVVMTMVAVVTMMVVVVVMVVVMVVIVIEQIVQETADETSSKTWQQTEHEIFSIVAGVARVCLMPTLRCLLTV
jgi:hypothetical protein